MVAQASQSETRAPSPPAIPAAAPPAVQESAPPVAAASAPEAELNVLADADYMLSMIMAGLGEGRCGSGRVGPWWVWLSRLRGGSLVGVAITTEGWVLGGCGYHD